MTEEKYLLKEVLDFANDLRITVPDCFKLFEWIDTNFLSFDSIETDLLEHINSYKNMNQVMKQLVDRDNMEILFDFTLDEYIKFNNLLVLEESQCIIHYEK